MLQKTFNMKIILLAIVLSLSLSCSKENETCWTCVVHYPTGDVIERPCTDSNDSPDFMDANNNPVAADCTKR